MLKGITASPGIGIGKAYKLEEEALVIDKSHVEEQSLEYEVARLQEAMEEARRQLEMLQQEIRHNGSKAAADILEAHLMILDDPMLTDDTVNGIRSQKIKAEHAFSLAVEAQVAIFEQIEDPYIRERAADLKDVGTRVLKNLLGMPIKDISRLEEAVILVAEDITPSQMAAADKRFVKGIVAEKGGLTSHTAILARMHEIPAVLGCHNAMKTMEDGWMAAVNGTLGTVEVQLDAERIAVLKEAVRRKEEAKIELLKIKDDMSETKDGHRVELFANIGKPEDVTVALENGAEGVGLFRTEFLFMDRATEPGEEEQFMAYRQAVEGMEGRTVIIRTLDAGGDKGIPYLDLPREENPFLGWRAIRICLDRADLFKSQLRAILRASAYGSIWIMYPMIASLKEVRKANEVLEDVKRQLELEGIPYDRSIKVGIMVEIPSAAVIADQLIKEADFFSIGTNDLTQYALAVDRGNGKVNHLYDSFHPAVLRLVQTTISAARKEGKTVGMCGELAGDPLAAVLLLGMGLDEFSMSPSAILKVKKIVRSIDLAYAGTVTQKVMEMEEPEEIRSYLEKVLKDLGLDYLLD